MKKRWPEPSYIDDTQLGWLFIGAIVAIAVAVTLWWLS